MYSDPVRTIKELRERTDVYGVNSVRVSSDLLVELANIATAAAKVRRSIEERTPAAYVGRDLLVVTDREALYDLEISLDKLAGRA